MRLLKKTIFYLLAFAVLCISALGVCAQEETNAAEAVAEPAYVYVDEEYHTRRQSLVCPVIGSDIDGAWLLSEEITEEAVELSNSLYNGFLSFDYEVFLYGDDGIKNYDQKYGLLTDDELEYVKEKAKEITSECTTDTEKIKAVAEYAALNICYDYDFTKHNAKTEDDLYTNAYDVLVYEYSICHGYALTCMALLQSLDIPCVFVESPNHAWNMAYNGERWILFDSTWMARGTMEYGVLTKSDYIDYLWYDFNIEQANSDYFHTVKRLDVMLVDGKLTVFPTYTTAKSVVIPDIVTEIGDTAFLRCKSVERVVVPDSVVTMGDYVFFECSELEEVMLGKNVNCIGYAAFYYCDSLEKINIPENVKYIDYSAFCGCKDLDEIIIPDSVESIDDQAFADCNDLTRIEIGDGVKSIGKLAFYNCTELESLVIGDGVTSIGENAFANCNSIESIVIGDGVTSLDHWYFGEALEGIVIGDGVTAIAEKTFLGLANLKNVVVGQGVKEIGFATFYNCTALACLQLSEGLTSIGEGAFQGCSALKTLDIPESVETIDLQSFALCTGFEEIRIGDGVTSIGENAFFGCSSLDSLSLGKNVESIGKAAFYNCGNLDTVRMGHKVENVGYAAFNGTKIKNVYYTGNANDWSSIEFAAYNGELTSANRNYVSNTSVELSGDTFKVECKNVPETGYELFICTYDGGRLKSAYIRTVKEISDDVFTLSDGVDAVKVFVLGSDGALVPITAGETLEI